MCNIESVDRLYHIYSPSYVCVCNLAARVRELAIMGVQRTDSVVVPSPLGSCLVSS